MELLTKSAIPEIARGKSYFDLQPTLQVIGIKPMKDGHRVVLSDGEYFDQFVVSSQNPSLNPETRLKVNQLVLVQKYEWVDYGDKKAKFIDAYSPGAEFGERVGNPTSIDKVDLESIQRSAQKDSAEYIPIRGLTTSTFDLAMKLRVTKKSEIRHWNNERGSGKLFNVNLLDSSGDEIQASFFNEAADMFYNTLEEDKVYVFKGGRVKMANQRFQTVKCDYALTFDQHSSITQAEDSGEIEKEKFSFVKIKDLPDKIRSVVDVCGVVTSPGEVAEITSRRGDQLKKRNLTLTDDSLRSIELTLWNKDAENEMLDASVGSVMVAKGVRVSDYQSCSLSSVKDTTKIMFNLAIPEVMALCNWYHNCYKSESALKITEKQGYGGKLGYKSFQEIREAYEDGPDKEDRVRVSGFIGYIRKEEPSSIWYTACKNSEACKRKVVKEADGYYKCEKCNDSFAECSYCYMASLKLQDHSGAFFVTCFDNTAEKIIGHSASYMQHLSETDTESFNNILTAPIGREIEGVLKIQVKDGKARGNLMAILENEPKKSLESYLEELEKLF